jgi:hypothetical protein
MTTFRGAGGTGNVPRLPPAESLAPIPSGDPCCPAPAASFGELDVSLQDEELTVFLGQIGKSLRSRRSCEKTDEHSHETACELIF